MTFPSDWSERDLQRRSFSEIATDKGCFARRTTTMFDGSHLDAFGRLQVSDPYKLFEYSASMPFDETRYWSKRLTGSGTFTRNATTTQLELATTTASGDKVEIQTRRSIQYNKGNAQEIFFIARPCPLANKKVQWGYFDDNNGIFWELDGLTPTLNIRSSVSGSPVETSIARSSWDDPLDGTGPSGLTLDFDKQAVYKFDFGWLSSRGVRFFVDVEGTFVLVKQWFISGTLNFPFMATGNLPIRYQVENTGTLASTSTSYMSCCAVQSSGSEVQEGAIRSVSTGITPINITTTPSIGAGIRLSSSFLNGALQPLDFKMLPVSGNTNVYFRVLYNPTIVGAVEDTSLSGIAVGLSSYTSFSGGSVINEGHFPLANKVTGAITALRELLNDIYVGREIDDTRDWLVIEFRTDSSTGTILFEGSYKEFA